MLGGVQAEQDAGLRPTLGRKPLPALNAEIPSRDRFPSRSDVTFYEFGSAAHLDAAKRRYGLEYDQYAP